MTGTLRTWARRYFWLLLVYIGLQTALFYAVYRAGAHSRDADVAAASTASAHCESVLFDCKRSFGDCSIYLSRAVESLGQCAAAKPCCTVRVEAAP